MYIRRCVAENAAGAAERRFEVDVVARTVGRPPIVRHGDPGNHSVGEGATVTLRSGAAKFNWTDLKSSMNWSPI